MTASHWDEPLLRAVAVLQVQLQLLDQQAEQFMELADMQAHRRIKSDLTEYIAAHARAGTVPADPLAELASRLRKLVRFFAESGTLHRAAISSHQRFLQDDLPSVSLLDVRQGQVELDEATAQFPASLKNLAVQLPYSRCRSQCQTPSFDWPVAGDTSKKEGGGGQSSGRA